jgi:ABC-type iron transport system FetAB ATPase subunit
MTETLNKASNFIKAFLAANAFLSPIIASGINQIISIVRQLQITTSLILIKVNSPACV